MFAVLLSLVVGFLISFSALPAPSSALDIGRPARFVEIFVQLARIEAVLLISVFGWAFHF